MLNNYYSAFIEILSGNSTLQASCRIAIRFAELMTNVSGLCDRIRNSFPPYSTIAYSGAFSLRGIYALQEYPTTCIARSEDCHVYTGGQVMREIIGFFFHCEEFEPVPCGTVMSVAYKAHLIVPDDPNPKGPQTT